MKNIVRISDAFYRYNEHTTACSIFADASIDLASLHAQIFTCLEYFGNLDILHFYFMYILDDKS